MRILRVHTRSLNSTTNCLLFYSDTHIIHSKFCMCCISDRLIVHFHLFHLFYCSTGTAPKTSLNLKVLQKSLMHLGLRESHCLGMWCRRSVWTAPSSQAQAQSQGRWGRPSAYPRRAVSHILIKGFSLWLLRMFHWLLSLPGNVFITYSMDTANDIIPFIGFLINQGFNPAVSPISINLCLTQTFHPNTHNLPALS